MNDVFEIGIEVTEKLMCLFTVIGLGRGPKLDFINTSHLLYRMYFIW